MTDAAESAMTALAHRVYDRDHTDPELLAAQHQKIADLASAQGSVIEAHAAVGGVDNVADKDAYAGG